MLPEIDSTNAEAARRASGLLGPTWILALRQVAGRGRRGRVWRDPEGNFAATYICRPQGPSDQVALRSFVAALALHDSLVAATGRPEAFALKWPNDVLLHGGKLAGILLESIGQGAQVGHLAVGIGVNLRDAPEVEPGAVAPVCLMGELGHAPTAQEFLNILAPNYNRWEQQLLTFGFAPIRRAWLDRAARLGQTIIVRTGSDTHEGIFEGLDASGALLLRGAFGTRSISAADVYFT